MKSSLLKKLAILLSVVMVVGSLTGCGDKSSETTTNESTTESEEAVDNTETASSDTPLVVGYDNFSSKFSTFFSKTSYDTDVADMTGGYVLATDRGGAVILNGIEGETVPYNGTDYTYYGLGDCVITQNDDGTVDYDLTIRDDVTFSDGTPVTIDDVIFSIYVLCDPTYDGSGSLYAQPIVGMNEYRSGMDSMVNVMLSAGRDNTNFDNWTEEEQTNLWAAIDKAGEAFAQEIVDYCVAAMGDNLASVGNSEVALGMVGWGFGSVNDDGSKVTGAGTGTEYDTATVTTADYWTELQAAYENDYATLNSTESAGSDLFELAYAELGDDAAIYQKGVNTGDSAANIAGIVKTGDYSLRISMSEFDATSIYQVAGIPVAPKHYYGSNDQYDYDNNMFGFTKGDLSLVRAKTTQPMGCGPYKFESYENGVVTFTANDSYFLGAPVTKTILFKETSATDKLTGVVSGTFDITDPTLNKSTIQSIKEYNPNGELNGDVLETYLIDFRGYGYMGLNANNMKVGNDAGSEESKALRKGFATLLAVYRDTVINSYYGELATVIQYPISNTSWAAPQPADEGYEIAYSKDVDGNPIYTEGMTEDEKYAAALEASIGFFKKAGYTWDDATGTFTAAPEGASMTYEFIIPASGSGDHPDYDILTSTKAALATIGITMEINDPADANELWNKTEGGTNEMWAAAWQATADPDMYQVYYSTNVVGGGGTESNTYGIQDDTLDKLIMEARSSADTSFRKATYKDAMDIILDWGVEVPAYQRQEGIVVSAERVNIDSLPSDMTPYYGWKAEIDKIAMK